MCYELSLHLNYNYVLQMTWFHQHVTKNLGDTFLFMSNNNVRWLKSPWLLWLHKIIISALSEGPLSWCFFRLLVFGAPTSVSELVPYTVSLFSETKPCSPTRSSCNLKTGCLKLSVLCSQLWLHCGHRLYFLA